MTTSRPLLDYKTTTTAIENIHGAACISDAFIVDHLRRFRQLLCQAVVVAVVAVQVVVATTPPMAVFMTVHV